MSINGLQHKTLSHLQHKHYSEGGKTHKCDTGIRLLGRKPHLKSGVGLASWQSSPGSTLHEVGRPGATSGGECKDRGVSTWAIVAAIFSLSSSTYQWQQWMRDSNLAFRKLSVWCIALITLWRQISESSSSPPHASFAIQLIYQNEYHFPIFLPSAEIISAIASKSKSCTDRLYEDKFWWTWKSLPSSLMHQDQHRPRSVITHVWWVQSKQQNCKHDPKIWPQLTLRCGTIWRIGCKAVIFNFQEVEARECGGPYNDEARRRGRLVSCWLAAVWLTIKGRTLGTINVPNTIWGAASTSQPWETVRTRHHLSSLLR